jgi:hypothetical protein
MKSGVTAFSMPETPSNVADIAAPMYVVGSNPKKIRNDDY